MKNELLFYQAYEDFYAMAARSEAFRAFCRVAFLEDFSQDGFSNKAQIDLILPFIPPNADARILDVGCGNGKMLGYLQRKTGAHISGFDYSQAAIRTAQRLFPDRSDFREGIIGQIDYPEAAFDVIISMDTMYFADDMTAFASQIKRWLKPGGTFFAGYTEGELMPRTENAHTSVLAGALRANGMPYEATDITPQTYDLLRCKRQAAMKHQDDFESEGNRRWFDMLMGQTECAAVPYGHFSRQMARYIFVSHKPR